MRCPSCGQRLADEARRCPVCGTEIDEETRQHAIEAAALEAGASVKMDTYQAAMDGAVTSENDHVEQKARPQYPAKPMKWYKFLIYFSLILTGFANIWTGVEAVMGMQYETKSQAAQVYALYPGLHILDIIYGVLLVVLGVYALLVRQYLARYKAKGPKMLLIMYIASLVLEVAYIGAGSLISGVNLLTASESGTMLISSILVSLFMIGANKVYFDKRAHLFNK